MAALTVMTLGLVSESWLHKHKEVQSNIPAWSIPWTKEPGGLQSMELQSQKWGSNLVRTHARTHMSDNVGRTLRTLAIHDWVTAGLQSLTMKTINLETRSDRKQDFTHQLLNVQQRTKILLGNLYNLMANMLYTSPFWHFQPGAVVSLWSSVSNLWALGSWQRSVYWTLVSVIHGPLFYKYGRCCGRSL